MRLLFVLTFGLSLSGCSAFYVSAVQGGVTRDGKAVRGNLRVEFSPRPLPRSFAK